MPTRTNNESKDDFLKRCIPQLINEGKDQDQAIAICEHLADGTMSIKEMVIDENSGVYGISLVQFPAIEKNFLRFNNDKYKNLSLAKIDTEKRIISGPAMLANKTIFRIDESTNEEYYTYFSEDTIRKIAEKFMFDENLKKVNIEHKYDTSDIYIFESWIVEDPKNDKCNALGYTDISKGSWFVSMKVNNDEVWNSYIKEDILRGFSVEGMFLSLGKFNITKESDFSIEMKQIEQILNILKDIEL